MKIVILVLLAIVILSLASGLVYLLRGGSESAEKMARALTVRISLSLLIIFLIILAFSMGWLQPHSLLPVPAQ